MKNLLGLSSVITVSVILISCNIKPDISESNSFLTILGTEFRKSGPLKTNLLYAGVKRVTINGSGYFEPKFLPYLEKAMIVSQRLEAFNEQSGKAAWEVAAKAGIESVKGSIKATEASKSNMTGKYSVFTLLNVNNFVKELNSSENKNNLELLQRYANPRIITSIAVVFDRESSEKISSSESFKLSIMYPQIGNPEISLKSESSAESAVKLSDGAIFAYEFSRICWEKRDGNIQVATLEVDRPGLDEINGNCPHGTDANASNFK